MGRLGDRRERGMTTSLFRSEAIAARRQRLMGEVTIAVPLRFHVLGLALLVVVAIAVAFLALADFSRKETVPGYLRPDRGIVKIRSPRAGVVHALFVEEGEEVRAGQPLLVLVSEVVAGDGRTVEEKLLKSLDAEIADLDERLALLGRKTAARRAALVDERAGLERERKALDRQLAVQRDLVRVARESHDAIRDLVGRGVVSQPEFKAREERLLTQRQQLAALAQRRSAIEARITAIGHELDRLPIEQEEARGDLLARRRSLERQRLELQGRREMTITAPIAGRVTALQAAVGEQTGNRPLLAIIPEGGRLEAELLVPARAIGFVRSGQEVRLAYDAFNYRRFGLAKGRVTAISRTILRPDEVPAPVVLDRPVYRVTVALSRESVVAYGRKWPLQPGMTLSADILLERRSLLAWLLDPLFALKGRM